MLATRNLSRAVLRCRPVSPRHRLLPVRSVTVLVGALLAVSLTGSGGADSAPALLQRAHDLRAANTALAARARAHEQAVAESLAARSATLERLRRDAAATTAAIATTRAQHAGYLVSLRAKERLNGAHISSLERAAQAAQAKSVALTPAPPAAPLAAPAGSAQAMSVVATAYSGTGATATGLAAGWGVVAVDPSVIPLGPRMPIPGS